MIAKRRNTVSVPWGSIWKTIILSIAVLVNISLGYRLFSGTHSLANYRHIKSELANIAASLEDMDRVNASLSEEIRLLQTDTRYVEKMIRQRLNYLKDNEILYLFEDRREPKPVGATEHAGKN